MKLRNLFPSIYSNKFNPFPPLPLLNSPKFGGIITLPNVSQTLLLLHLKNIPIKEKYVICSPPLFSLFSLFLYSHLPLNIETHRKGVWSTKSISWYSVVCKVTFEVIYRGHSIRSIHLNPTTSCSSHVKSRYIGSV
jgi:hypothetical protein